MNKLFKLAVLSVAVLFAVETSAATSSRSSYKSSSYKTSSYKPSKAVVKTKRTKPVKRKSYATEEVEYFALQDCQRHITLSFNGYKCIDRD